MEYGDYNITKMFVYGVPGYMVWHRPTKVLLAGPMDTADEARTFCNNHKQGKA